MPQDAEKQKKSRIERIKHRFLFAILIPKRKKCTSNELVSSSTKICLGAAFDELTFPNITKIAFVLSVGTHPFRKNHILLSLLFASD